MKPSPERATLERQGKRKAEADGKRNKTSGGGGGQKRLNQPDTAKTNNNLSTQRAKPTWREENARTHEKGTHGELVNDMIHPHCMQSVVIRLKGPRLSRPNPVNGLSCQPLNYVHKFQPHRENQKKETTPGKHVLIPPKMPCHVANSRAPYSLGHHWKNGCCRSFRLCSEKTTGRIEATRRPVVQPSDIDRVRIEKWPAVHFT